jgi:hypothetical protein
MSRLISLYPTRWRARYEDEPRDALSVRPMTVRDRVDLVRGALDAWLHPELSPPHPARPFLSDPIWGAARPCIGRRSR